MKSFVDAVLACQATGVKKEKLEALAKLDATGKRLMVEALSPYRVFGVKKYPTPTKHANTTPDQEDPIWILSLLDDLAARQLTGNAARDTIVAVLESYGRETQEVLALVLNKDLKAGFSADSLNTVFPGLVPTFEVMLAEKMSEKYKWKFPLLAEYKYDGERTIAICEHGAVTYFSRSGKPADHCNGLFDEDMIKLEAALGFPVVVDGERYASNFTETMNAKKSGDSKAKENLRLRAYDIMSLDDWKNHTCKLTQKFRRFALDAALQKARCVKITLSIGVLVNSVQEAKDYFETALKDGYEGLILKDLDGMYEWDRSKSWTKYKPVYSFDGRITGFYAGKKGSRLENTLGGITVEGVDENGNKFECDCGSGFDDDTRKEFWDNQKSYLGKMVEIEAQEMSKAANSDVFSLRFPIFIRIRDDKE